MKLDTYLRFVVFALTNPDVYDRLVSNLRRVKDRGYTFYSVKTCWAVLRWQIATERGPDEEYNLNDAYQSYYARLIYARFPDLRGFFELREREGELTNADVFARLNNDFATGYLPTPASIPPMPAVTLLDEPEPQEDEEQSA